MATAIPVHTGRPAGRPLAFGQPADTLTPARGTVYKNQIQQTHTRRSAQHEAGNLRQTNRQNRIHDATPNARTRTRILMKIRLDEVVASSLRRMVSRHVQGRASVYSRWAKNLATFRSLLVSSLHAGAM